MWRQKMKASVQEGRYVNGLWVRKGEELMVCAS